MRRLRGGWTEIAIPIAVDKYNGFIRVALETTSGSTSQKLSRFVPLFIGQVQKDLNVTVTKFVYDGLNVGETPHPDDE